MQIKATSQSGEIILAASRNSNLLFYVVVNKWRIGVGIEAAEYPEYAVLLAAQKSGVHTPENIEARGSINMNLSSM